MRHSVHELYFPEHIRPVVFACIHFKHHNRSTGPVSYLCQTIIHNVHTSYQSLNLLSQHYTIYYGVNFDISETKDKYWMLKYDRGLVLLNNYRYIFIFRCVQYFAISVRANLERNLEQVMFVERLNSTWPAPGVRLRINIQI